MSLVKIQNQLLCQQRLLCMCYQQAKDLVLKITFNGEKEDWPAYKTIVMAYTENRNVAYTLNRDMYRGDVSKYQYNP